jgi:anti-anti-sigma factor
VTGVDGFDADIRHPMSFAICEQDPETTVVWIRGELDVSNVGELERAIAPVIERRVSRLILDVADLAFADSFAISVWVAWGAAVGELRLRRVSPLLRTVIVTMGLAGKLRFER